MDRTSDQYYRWRKWTIFRRFLVIFFLAQLAMIADAFSQSGVLATQNSPYRAISAHVDKNFANFPLYFIENRGQMDSHVIYYLKGGDKTLYFTPQGLVFVLTGKEQFSTFNKTRIRKASYPFGPVKSGPKPTLQRWVVGLDFVGANPKVKPLGLDPTPAVISYFKGPSDQWKTGLKTYAGLIYRDLWPGIDLVYTGTVNRLKYRFVVKPGADPDSIRLAYRGAELTISDAGQLKVATPVASFNDEMPFAFQEMEGRHKQVNCFYHLEVSQDKNTSLYGFKVEPYDQTKTLVLDPAILVYCGFIGGSGDDVGTDIAVDDQGNAYITGKTTSTDFPSTIGPDTEYSGSTDAFVAKVETDGSGLVYCGYIGGSGNDVGNGIALDSNFNAFITGYTTSDEKTFPITQGPDLTFNGVNDAFAAKLSANGMKLIYCGYIGGKGNDYANDIAVDNTGCAYVIGNARSNEDSFPVTVGPDLTLNGDPEYVSDAFVAKIKANPNATDDPKNNFHYCGYIGGDSGAWGSGIVVDNKGCAYVTGSTMSTELSFPVTVGPDLTKNGYTWNDAFVAKINVVPDAKDDPRNNFHYCGYIGGYETDYGEDIAIDTDGCAYVVGSTATPELVPKDPLPLTVGPDLTFNGGYDVFVAKLKKIPSVTDDPETYDVNEETENFHYCGYIGGDDHDNGYSIAVDTQGNAYVTGYTASDENTFPVKEGPDLTFNGPGATYRSDVFVVKLKAVPNATDDPRNIFHYCGYIGGSDDDLGWGIAVDENQSAYVVGYTMSDQKTFPEIMGPYLTHNGGKDAFVAKIGAPIMIKKAMPWIPLLLLDE